MKTIFIGVVLLFLFSACTNKEALATTFAPQTDNPTSLQKTTDVTLAATPTDAVYVQ